MAILEQILSSLTLPLAGQVLAILAVVLLARMYYNIHNSNTNKVNFTDLFIDSKTGKV